MKKLVVNADDFGMSKDINLGIIEAHQKGVVTSTSIMANGKYFSEALLLAKENPGLGIGVHLNLTEGRAICKSQKIQSLLNGKQEFLGTTTALGRRILFQKVKYEEVLIEFCAQIEKVLDGGIRPTHLDGHMHIQCFPIVCRAILTAANLYGIKWVRFPREKVAWSKSALVLGLKSFCISTMTQLSMFKYPPGKIIVADEFIGIQLMGNLTTENILSSIDRSEGEAMELMCHPSLGTGDDNYIKRKNELDALTSEKLRFELKKKAIELRHFGQINYEAR